MRFVGGGGLVPTSADTNSAPLFSAFSASRGTGVGCPGCVHNVYRVEEERMPLRKIPGIAGSAVMLNKRLKHES